MNTKMTKVIGIVAVLALVAVAFVGAGAAAGTTYYVSDDGIDSDAQSSPEQPMSTTKFLTKTIQSVDTVTIPANKTMTVPSGTTLKLNGAAFEVNGTVNVNGNLETVSYANITSVGKINVASGSEFRITGAPTNDLTQFNSKLGAVKKGTIIYVAPSTTVSGAKWVVDSDTTGSSLADSGSSKNATRTNLDPNSNTTIVGYDNPVTYTVVIPESVTLNTSNPVDVDYKITVGNGSASSDNRAIVMKVASSANGFNVKNIYGGDTVQYHMVLMDSNPGKMDITTGNTPIAAIMVDGSISKYNNKTWQTPVNKCVTSNINFAGNADGTGGVTFTKAGNYQDTLTFSVGIEDSEHVSMVKLYLSRYYTGAVWDGYMGTGVINLNDQYDYVLVPLGSIITATIEDSCPGECEYCGEGPHTNDEAHINVGGIDAYGNSSCDANGVEGYTLYWYDDDGTLHSKDLESGVDTVSQENMIIFARNSDDDELTTTLGLDDDGTSVVTWAGPGVNGYSVTVEKDSIISVGAVGSDTISITFNAGVCNQTITASTEEGHFINMKYDDDDISSGQTSVGEGSGDIYAEVWIDEYVSLYLVKDSDAVFNGWYNDNDDVKSYSDKYNYVEVIDFSTIYTAEEEYYDCDVCGDEEIRAHINVSVDNIDIYGDTCSDHNGVSGFRLYTVSDDGTVEVTTDVVGKQIQSDPTSIILAYSDETYDYWLLTTLNLDNINDAGEGDFSVTWSDGDDDIDSIDVPLASKITYTFIADTSVNVTFTEGTWTKTITAEVDDPETMYLFQVYIDDVGEIESGEYYVNNWNSEKTLYAIGSPREE